MSKNARVLRNILALLISQVGTWSASFIFTLIVPSYLGARLYGLDSFVGTYAGFFGLGVVLGTGTFLTWRIAREPHGASDLLVNTLVMQVPLWVFWSVVALGLVRLIDGSVLTRQLTILSLIAMLFASLSSTCVSALSGFQIMRTPAFIGVATALAGVASALICAHAHANLITFVACYVICQLGNFVVMLVYTHRRIPLRARVNPRLWPRIIAGGAPFFAWSVVLIFYWQIDVIMLKAMVGDAVVGWYSLANRIISIPAFLPSIVVAAILPALSHEHNAESPYFRKLASRAIRLVAAVNIPASVGIVLLASRATALLHFPASYGNLSPLIVILSINMPIAAVDMVLATVLTAMGRQNVWTCVGLVAAVLNPLVNLWAIPFTQHMFGDGAIGASLTTIQSEVIMFVGAMMLRPKSIFTRWDVWYISRCLVAGAIMIPAVKAFETGTSNLSLMLAIAYGGLVYVLACYALRVLTEDDLKSAVSLLTTKVGLGDGADLHLDRVFERFTGAATREAAARRVAYARTTLSRPLALASRPLARAWTAAVSQPLSRSGVTGESATTRYWAPREWLIHTATTLSANIADENGKNGQANAATDSRCAADVPPDSSVTLMAPVEAQVDVCAGEVLAPRSRDIAMEPIPVRPLHLLALEDVSTSDATHASAHGH